MKGTHVQRTINTERRYNKEIPIAGGRADMKSKGNGGNRKELGIPKNPKPPGGVRPSRLNAGGDLKWRGSRG